MNHSKHFPADFTWGVATSAFQIEGASAADGSTSSLGDSSGAVPAANGHSMPMAGSSHRTPPSDAGS